MASLEPQLPDVSNTEELPLNLDDPNTDFASTLFGLHS